MTAQSVSRHIGGSGKFHCPAGAVSVSILDQATVNGQPVIETDDGWIRYASSGTAGLPVKGWRESAAACCPNGANYAEMINGTIACFRSTADGTNPFGQPTSMGTGSIASARQLQADADPLTVDESFKVYMYTATGFDDVETGAIGDVEEAADVGAAGADSAFADADVHDAGFAAAGPTEHLL
eukprot:tig00000552_g2071.t1